MILNIMFNAYSIHIQNLNIIFLQLCITDVSNFGSHSAGDF